MAYTLTFEADFGSLTGLTLNAQLYDTAGGATGAAITTGFVEIGNGVYTYTHTALPDAHRGSFVMYDSGDASRKVSFSVNPQEAEYIDEKSSQATTDIAALNDPSAVDIRTEMDSNSTQLSAIVADTNELQGDWADGGRLDLILDGTATPSEVNAEVLDVLNTDTFAELSGVPAATSTLVDKINWLFASRNYRCISR